ncbi:polyphenol oxidase family protein [uncultured Muribaculum sp.]|uniref:polyphenol oxidase family protein n=1 Tax=uncultured Muribaculum sp. TaxID=1918613 RepID=UPI0025CEA9B7|nr:polyphenol oxidase family protein [uncultured Muribaculum sp.]
MENDGRRSLEIPVKPLYDSPQVIAATTSRGLHSDSDPYSGFSLCHYVGDRKGHWTQCRRALARYLGISSEYLVVPRQTHSVRVALIGELPAGDDCLDGVDAVVTKLPRVAVGVNTADCLPLLLFDEHAHVIAAVHAGWRGAVGGIVDNALDVMIQAGAHIGDIHAYIAPHIGACCFEVGDEVAARFDSDDVTRMAGRRPHVSLASSVVRSLMGFGLLADNIISSGECTRCTPGRYFSARALGIASGRNFSFVMLKE